MYTSKNKEAMLKYLLNNRRALSDDIYMPVGLLDRFPPLSKSDCWSLLSVLEDEDLISVQTADYPENDNIFMINVLPPCLSYFQRKAEKKREIRRNWTINISIALASAIFGAGLARLSILLWP